MTKMSRQKLKYLENKKSFWREIKSIFHHFKRTFSCRNLSQTWQCAFKISIKAICGIATKIIRHETDGKITEKELNIATEKETRLIQICKLIDSYCGNVENISPFKNTPFKNTLFKSGKGKQMSNSGKKSRPILNKTPRNILSQHEHFSLPSLRHKTWSYSVLQDDNSRASH